MAIIATLRLNQALALLKSSFPISEYSSDDKCLIVATTMPEHLSFKSFKDIFLYGTNHTSIEISRQHDRQDALLLLSRISYRAQILD